MLKYLLGRQPFKQEAVVASIPFSKYDILHWVQLLTLPSHI
jgi:hypothetical protein